jgi:hypothetical protein
MLPIRLLMIRLLLRKLLLKSKQILAESTEPVYLLRGGRLDSLWEGS